MPRLSPILLLCLPALAAQPAQGPPGPDPTLAAGREAWLAEPAAASPDRPNIVLIVADDLGRHEIGLNGGPVPTPNIDRIGREGASCSQGTVASPICSPSRAGLLTGRYPQRFGFELIAHERYAKGRAEHFAARFFAADDSWRLPPYQPAPEGIALQGLPTSEITLAEALRKAGYSTVMLGKWHLGVSDGLLPMDRGFDEHFGFYGAFSLYAPEHDPGVVGSRHSYFADKHEWGQARQGSSGLYRDGQPTEDDGYLTQTLAAEAARAIDAHKDGPFFLYLPFSAPHTPFQAPRALLERFPNAKDENQRVYWAMIAALDEAVGEVLAALDASGLGEDTLVVFLSDNGGALYTGAADNSPLRGGKLSNFEGGINVPWLLRFPGRVPAGAACAAPVSALDIFPTALGVAGLPLPDDRAYDGVDILPYLRGEAPPPHESLFWRTDTHKAIRRGDWKLIVDEATGWRGLFNLADDAGERENLAAERPGRVWAMEAELAAWEAQMVPPAWPRVMEYHWEGGEIVFPL